MEEPPAISYRHAFRQVFAGLVYSMSHMSAGSAIGFISVFLTQEALSPSLPISSDERTWVVSAYPIGMVLGNIVSAAVTPLLGYRRMSLLCSPLSAASWCLLLFSRHFVPLLLARIVTGVAMGAFDASARAYVGEITDSRLRGSVMMLMSLLMAVNTLTVYAISSQMNWRFAVGITALPPYLLQFFGSLWLPESGKWLITHGHSEKMAGRSLKFFRGGHMVDKEIKAVRNSVASDESGDNSCQLTYWQRLSSLFGNSGSRRAFLLLSAQLVLVEYNAGEVVSNFGTVLFEQSARDYNPYHSAICVGVSRIAGFLMSVWLFERVRRQLLLQVAAAIQCVGGCLVAVYFHLASLGVQELPVLLVQCGCLLIYFAYGFGVMPVTWLLFAELMPNKVRAISLNLLLILFGLLMFSFMHVYRECELLLGTHTAFWLLSVLSLVQIVFSRRWLPETRGLTLEEIEDKYFSDESKTKSSTQLKGIAGDAPRL